jgi:very-short-patch-repair endonuclease
MRQVDGTEALARARELRRRSTEAEKRLWAELRNRRLRGFKFRRQVWIGPFVVDFVCVDERLVVELDGSQHADRSDYDGRRSEVLAGEGYQVIRFWNNEVTENIAGVLDAIVAALVPSPSHAALPRGPLPLPPGEGD